MAKSKVFELRDRATFIPIIATQLGSDDDQERWLMAQAGFGRSSESQKFYVILTSLNHAEKTEIDPNAWDSSVRTYSAAHRYITENFESLVEGQVIDVEWILMETLEPKISQRKQTGD